MAKLKKAFFCQNCGAQYVKWQGQCNSCKSWNSLVEEIIENDAATPKCSGVTNKSVQSTISIN